LVVVIIIFLVLVVRFLLRLLLLLVSTAALFLAAFIRFRCLLIIHIVAGGACDGDHDVLVADELLDHGLHEGDEGLGLLEDDRGDHLAVLHLEVSIREETLLHRRQSVEIYAAQVLLAQPHLRELAVIVEVEEEVRRFTQQVRSLSG
jgi:hypothetical protein